MVIMMLLINLLENVNVLLNQVLIEFPNKIQDDCKNIDEDNPDEIQKILIVFDDLISNKKLNPIVTELFIRGINQTFLLPLNTVMFCSTKRSQTTLCARHYYENSKQKRT